MDNNQNTATQNNAQPQYQQQPQPMYQQPIVANPCPRCGYEMTSKYRAWQIWISVLLFPIGLLSLAAGKQKKCSHCGHIVS